MQRCIDQHLSGVRIGRWTLRLGAILALGLAGCSTMRAPNPSPAPIDAGRSAVRPAPAPSREGGNPTGSAAPALPAAGSGRGGYYLDDGPGDAPPAGLQSIPDAEPRIEPYSMRGNRPYVVFGKTYTPITDNNPFKQRGVGSWYGKKFHGQKTSSGELYDMYKMTAAHPTLPIPSYARVTNVRTGAQVIVRVNDRGPFHSSRIIDLSYTAALKLGYLAHGSSELEVERLLPDDIARMNNGSRKNEIAATRPLAVTPAIVAMTLNPAQTPTPAPALATVLATAPAASLSIEDFLKAQDNAAPFAGMAINPVAPSLLPVPSVGSAGNAAVLPDNPGTVLPLPGVTGMAASLLADNAATGEPAASGTPRTPGAPALAPGGFYLQFGAFGQSSNAEAARQRLALQWPTSLPAPEVRPSGAVYRLYSGPFGSRNDALAAARLLPDNPAAKPLIVQR